MNILRGFFTGILFSLALAAVSTALQAPGKNQLAEKTGSASAAEVKRGKTVFDMHCAVCHYVGSTAKKIGPGLKSLTKRGTPGPDGKPLNDASLRAQIEKGGKNMPGFRATLSNQQISDLVSYLKSL